MQGVELMVKSFFENFLPCLYQIRTYIIYCSQPMGGGVSRRGWVTVTLSTRNEL